MDNLNLTAIPGSLRKDSLNLALLHSAQELAPKEVTINIIDIGNLPLFNEDLESNFPTEAQEMNFQLEHTDGVIISTPEYNRSVPGVLKNAIDWTSRPYGENAWPGKPVYVIGASAGPLATSIAQSHLKHTLLYLDALVLGQPEFFLGNAYDKFDEDGKLTHEETRNFLEESLIKFSDFVRHQRIKASQRIGNKEVIL